MKDPFKITGPAVVSFSGGRTSGYMLWRVLEAHGGTLPEDVLVSFQNTGKEREETLRFVERCSCEWGVPIVWLEYRHTKGVGPSFEIVNYATASRNGEPFEAAITARAGDSGFLPNPVTRYCTIEMKIKTTIRYLESLSWQSWTNAVGFRADEPQRVAKLRAAVRDEREDSVAPLHQAGIGKREVMAFWEANSFDLELGPDEGNCDLCFLKGAGKLERLMRKWPDAADWWIRQEERGGLFRSDRPRYTALRVRSEHPQIPGMEDEPDELSVACHCTD